MSNESKRIVIIGERYATNLGDGVICRCVEHLIRQYADSRDRILCLDLSCRKNYDEKYIFNNSLLQRVSKSIYNRIVRIGFVKEQMRQTMGDKLYTYWSWYNEDRAILHRVCKDNQADLVVFAGGELFKDYFVFYIREYVKLFTKQKTKIWFNACGCDINNSLYVLKIFKKMLHNKHIKRFTTRNMLTSCEGLFSKEQYSFVPDPVICAADFYSRNSFVKKGTVGLGIMAIDDLEDKREELLSYWGAIVSELEKEGKEYYLFCNGAPEDYVFAQEVVSYANISDEKLMAIAKTPEELVEQITTFDEICAFRMHSIIIAYAFQIPFVGFGWEQKLLDFSKYAGVEKQIIDWERTDAKSTIEIMHNCVFVQGRLQELKKKVYEEFREGISCGDY